MKTLVKYNALMTDASLKNINMENDIKQSKTTEKQNDTAGLHSSPLDCYVGNFSNVEAVLFEIAKIIDNSFIGSEETFSCCRHIGYYLLTTNKCDDASFIRVYTDNENMLTEITRLGPDTNGYIAVQMETLKRICMLINRT